MADTNKKARKNKIAVFTNGWSCEFLSEVFEGIRKEAEADGVDVFVYLTYNLPTGVNSAARNQMQLFHLFDPEEYDGVIVLANTMNIVEEKNAINDILTSCSIPAVSTALRMPGAALINTDNYQGAYELAEHIVEHHGAKDIIFISGYEGNEESAVRKKALEDVLGRQGLSVRDTIYCNFDFYMAIHTMQDWLDAGNKLPDAFVCANDHMALGVISALYVKGIKVPEEVMVTGYDDILDARFSYPSVATVSRQLGELGSQAYKELQHQIEDRDPSREILIQSHFIPTESCGCPTSDATVNLRLKKMRNFFFENNETNMVDFFFQEIRVGMAQTENKEQFHSVADRTLGRREFFGKNYCLCTEPLFFELDDNAIRKSSERFHDQMDVLYELGDGQSRPLRQFNSSEIYPGYQKEPGKSNIYILSAMYGNNIAIGYLIMKNYPQIMYDLRFKRWLNNMESLLVTVRQYIFSQKANRQLSEIYMNDFLTGMYNRTGCEDVLFSYIEKRKSEGKYTALLFADINFMKKINDGYGHLNGDLAIKATARALRNALSEGWLFGRYGGDEFIAVGPCEGTIDIDKYRADFADAMEKIKERLKLSFELSASLGFCIISPEDVGYIGDFIRIADMSMYEEKQRMHELLSGS